MLGLVSPGFSYAVDSDADGVSDSIEIQYGYDHTDPNETPTISLVKSVIINGTSENQYLGGEVEVLGDITKDGINDYAVTLLGEDSVRIYSGADHSIITTLTGDANSDYGESLASLGDINNDTYPDFAIGAPGLRNANGVVGQVTIYSGANFSVLHSYTGSTHLENLGQTIALAGDMDGNGHSELLIGNCSAGIVCDGYVKIYDLNTWGLIREISAFQAEMQFSASLDGVGDFNGDGKDDIAIGAPSYDSGHSNAGILYFLRNTETGSSSWSKSSPTGETGMGFSISKLGDVDKDTYDDFLVSSRNKVYIIGGDSVHVGQSLFELSINSAIVSSAGDLNADDYPDFAIANTSQSIQFYSGKDFSQLQVVSGNANSFFGRDMAVLGDINGDGYDDMLVGALGDSVNVQYGGSFTILQSGVDLDNDGITDDIDTDDDGDGLSETEENTLGTSDKLLDSDGDGLTDANEVNLHLTDPAMADTDSDGLTDAAELNVHSTNPNLADTDNDGLNDGLEINTHNTNANISDTDNDGLTDGDEVNTYSSNPLNSDTDSDSLSDGFEVNTLGTSPVLADTDGDQLNDNVEVNTYSSNPLSDDSDSDGLLDGDEVNNHNTSPISSDSDSDGLNDNVEINTHNTNPTLADTDNDGLGDGAELNSHSTNPLIADTDSDGVIDGAEIDLGSNPNNTDSDNDGLTDGQEVNTYGTSPILVDTDSDSLSDTAEVNTHLTNPLLADSDGDGLADNDEINTHTTNPLKMDSDGNGINDYLEVNGQTNIAPNWLVSSAEASFQTQVNIARPSNINKVLAADFNLDGLVDLVYAATNNISLSYQNADHSFTEPMTLGTGNVDQWVIADIDGDSDSDIYYAEGYNLRVIINNGVNGFAVQSSSQHMGYTPNQLIASDFDDARNGEELIWVQKNTSYQASYDLSDNSIVRTNLSMAMNNTINANFVDLTNDGLLDQLLEYSGYTYWAENLDNDSFTPNNAAANNLRFDSYNSASPHLAAKLTGGEFNDVVFGNRHKVYLMKNNGNGQFTDKEIIAEIANTGTIVELQPADIDLDGDVDILVGATDAIYLVKNNGDETFTLTEISPLVSGLNDIQVSDINRDGSLDIISTSASDQKLSWYQNSSSLVTGPQAIAHKEFLTQVDLPVSAYDANNDALQFSLTGADSDLFEYSIANGLVFKTAPTLASPADVGGDNIYDLVISASDGVIATDLTVQVTVQADLVDSDNDGLTDAQESNLGTNPNLADSDNDGLSDGLEVNTHNTNPLLADTDSDGLSDGLEVNTHSTNPLTADSDNDGINDGDEITAGSNPNVNEAAQNVDSDGDTLSDIEETNTYGTDINLIDTDADGVNDGDEVAVGTDPAIANSDYIISFEDGLLPAGLPVIEGSSAWAADESSATHGRFSLKANTPVNDQASSIRLTAAFAETQLVFNAKVSSESESDYLIITLDESQELLRLSGELDWQEYRLDIPAGNHTIDFSYTKDIDGSAGSDTAWIDHIRFTVDSNAAVVDSDNDTLTDVREEALGTDPNNIDSDFDGVNDADEVILGTNPMLIEMRKTIGFEDGLKPSGIGEATNATKGWAVDSTTASVGNFSFKAKAINNGENAQAAFWANFSGGNVTFDVKVSTQLGSAGFADPNALEALVIFVDSTPVWILSGEHDWLSSSITVPAGLHSVAFVYFKKADIDSGSDTVWIDNVQFDIAEYGVNADMDQDGLYDRLEAENGGIMWVADTDGDGLLDGEEVNLYGTDPTLIDTDNNGIDDKTEVDLGNITDGSETGNGDSGNEGDSGNDNSGGENDANNDQGDSKLGGSSGGHIGGFILLLVFLAWRRRYQ